MLDIGTSRYMLNLHRYIIFGRLKCNLGIMSSKVRTNTKALNIQQIRASKTTYTRNKMENVHKGELFDDLNIFD